MSSLLGGAALVTFPALLMLGLSPTAAAIVNTVALLPVSLAATYYERSQLPKIDATVLKLIVTSAAAVLAEAARSVAGVDVRGPAPAPIARLRGRYRFRVLIRAKDRDKLREGAYRMVAAIAELPRDVRAVLDVDPVQFL